jgi:hypothetical protein
VASPSTSCVAAVTWVTLPSTTSADALPFFLCLGSLWTTSSTASPGCAANSCRIRSVVYPPAWHQQQHSSGDTEISTMLPAAGCHVWWQRLGADCRCHDAYVGISRCRARRRQHPLLPATVPAYAQSTTHHSSQVNHKAHRQLTVLPLTDGGVPGHFDRLHQQLRRLVWCSRRRARPFCTAGGGCSPAGAPCCICCCCLPAGGLRGSAGA